MDHLILIEDMAFADPVKTITIGDRMIWQNNDAMGQTASRTEAPSFDTGIIAHGHQSGPITFSEITSAEGIDYHCLPHPFMRAKLIVSAALPPHQ